MSRENTDQTTRPDLIVRTAGVLLMIAAGFIPWIAFRGGSERFSIVDLTWTRWVVAALIALIAASSAPIRRGASQMVTKGIIIGSSLILLVVPLFTLVVIEIATIWTSPAVLPATLRRSFFGVEPLIGIWLTILGASLTIGSVTGLAQPLLERIGDTWHGVRGHDLSSMGVLVAAITIPILILGRYSPWIKVTSSIGNWGMPGFAIPFIGVATLLCFLVVLGLTLLSVFQPSVGGGAALSIIGWLLTIISAALLVIMRAAPSFFVQSTWLHDHLTRWTSKITTVCGADHSTDACIPTKWTGHLSAGAGTWWIFAAGCLLALAGTLICLSATRVRSERAWT